jgi:endonuclease/exonuclease/phosphatase family metal-dependent hydrolase
MTYNIQSGFALDRTWNLEETARTIQAEDPDIVVL